MKLFSACRFFSPGITAGFLLFASAVRSTFAAEQPSAATNWLSGAWGGEVEMGKMKLRLVLHFKHEADGRLLGMMDVPDQGAKDLPVSAILFNDPFLRLEFDQFNGSYNGKLDTNTMTFTGSLEGGPRPMDVVFRRLSAEDLKEPERSYTFKPGEKKDFRGYWKGKMALGPTTARINLKIGKLGEGKFDAKLDILDFGAKDLPAASTTVSNQSIRLEWPMFGANIRCDLDPSGDRMTAEGKQGGKSNIVELIRTDKPEGILPDNLKFVPTKDTEDIAGYWKGVLEVPNGKLRLSVKIGKAPDANYAATMKSLDQGSGEMPASSITYKSGEAKLEWQTINGTFTGKLSADGKDLKGEWKQGPAPAPLTLTRTTLDQLDK